MDGYTMADDRALTHHVVMGIIGVTFLVLASFSELFSMSTASVTNIHERDIYWLMFTGFGLMFMGASVVSTVYSWDRLQRQVKRGVLLSVSVMIVIFLFQVFIQVYRYLNV